MEKLNDIARWTYVKLLQVFAYVDEALAYWEQRLIDYVNKADRYRETTDIFHLASECKHPDICPYYGHREAWELGQNTATGIGLHNKGAQDEREQAGYG